MRTEDLIQQLAGKAAPTRRLPAPWQRTAIWFAISAAYAGAIVLINPDGFSRGDMADPRFVIEQIATLATAVTAAIAAFCSIIPGYDRRWLLLPIVPLAIWLGALGEGCMHDWLQWGREGLQLHIDWGCLPNATKIVIVPAIAIVLMLQRGAPLVPSASLATGALAVGALTNFAMRFFHYGDVTIMLLAWHFGAALVLAAIASVAGRYVLKWHRTRSLG